MPWGMLGCMGIWVGLTALAWIVLDSFIQSEPEEEDDEQDGDY